ncbi:ORF6N domain-containing protein [Sphingobacterium pedocola]|uniref:KilA-N DNA-binding domain-containing protein n=1 Tax=Sphingobacterium pedocola TaxID=2082722 RepID=A0ABR9T7G7_9SPHI|nr:ORF6N domain-containing protein [Sphingobacterium pedocola]MBE8721240.1 hypothetical protein [Sphingobacterium pedocola]
MESKRLKRQLRRNINRFPLDFMFELSKEEHEDCKVELTIGFFVIFNHATRYLCYYQTKQYDFNLSTLCIYETAAEMGIPWR